MTTPPPPSSREARNSGPQSGPAWRQGFKRRLGYYAFGLAIGTVMALLMWQLRMMAARSGPHGAGTGMPGSGSTTPARP